MRVTQQMLNSQMLNSLNKNLNRTQKIQEQLSTGKKINRPSDDPVGLSASMRYRSEIQANEQYQRNMDTAKSWLDVTETTTGQASDILQRASELTIQGATESNSQGSRNAIASEIDELIEELREIANTEFNGKHIFNGQRTDQKPYPEADSFETDDYDNGHIRFEVSRGVNMDVNVHAGEVFGASGDADNAFQALTDISEALKTGDQAGVDQGIGKLNSRLDKMLEQRSAIGAKTNRMELIENRLKDGGINIQTLMSREEDVDMAAAITNLKTEENIYRASLSASARVIQPSLLDFLR